MKKVTKLFKSTNNCFKISCEDTIENFQEFLSENPDFNKIILVALNTKGQAFNFQWMKAQILNSESIALLKLVIDDFIEQLKGVTKCH